MPYWTYILYNPTIDKFYVGQTSNLELRLKSHNDHSHGRKRYTQKQAGSWNLIHSEEYATRSEAISREKFLKSGIGRNWITQNIGRQSPPQAD